MKVKLNPNSRGIIKTLLGEFHRSLENDKNIFYVNYSEKDKNVSVLMFNRKRVLISNNISAYTELERVLAAEEYSWKSKHLENNK